MKIVKRWLYASATIASSLAYLAFTSPSSVVIDKNGNIDGFQNEIRLVLQQNKFSLSQKHLVIKRIQLLEEEPLGDKELEKSIKELETGLDEITIQFLKDYPDAKPSKAELSAERLRKKADATEEMRFKKQMNKWRLEEIAELKMTLEYLANITNTDTKITWKDYQ